MSLAANSCREIAATVASLYDAEVAADAAKPEANLDALFPDERLHVRLAVLKRQAEFATARVCARRALSSLGFESCSLVPHADRSPRWPRGVVGSITHTTALCAAVVAKEHDVASIGLDIESDEGLPPELEALICTGNEVAWLNRYPEGERGNWVKLFFSAKEAVYKCQYPKTRVFLSFQDLELDIDTTTRSFATNFLKHLGDEWGCLRGLRGRWVWQHGLVIAGALLRHPD